MGATFDIGGWLDPTHMNFHNARSTTLSWCTNVLAIKLTIIQIPIWTLLVDSWKILSYELNKFLAYITKTDDSAITLDIDDLLKIGESNFLEVKATFQWDAKQNKVNVEYRDAIVEAIAGFANADGGTILIGVSKEGEILGLEDDYNTFGDDSNHFKNNLQNLIRTSFADGIVNNMVSITYHRKNELEICQIDIRKSDKPIYITLKDRYGLSNECFFVRVGNCAEELQKERIVNYIRQRFDVFK